MDHSYTHAIMFHHFHNENHPKTQGSIDKYEFKLILSWLKENFSLIGAKEYFKRFKENSLSPSDVCLTFDDALKCQYDVALPILEEQNIDAYFFVYSSAFSNKPDMLEVYRLFRTCKYSSLKTFYLDFFKIVEDYDKKTYQEKQLIYKNRNYLKEFPFYSEEDKWFRFIRDQYLNHNTYTKIMKKMMNSKNFDYKQAMKNLWISENCLKDISNKGHTIGLHSYSHPTKISKLGIDQQKLEYEKNLEHLTKIIQKKINSMSHPCGDYSNDTLKILKDIGIEIGFRSNFSIPNIRSPLEVPRENHANILKEINF